MKPHRLSILAAATWMSLAVGAAAQTQPEAWTPELALQVKRVGGVAVSPDGEHVAFQVGRTRMEGERSEWVTHIFLANRDGSDQRQLTQGERSATSPAWSPDGRWIAFVSSRSGESNLWRLPVDGGEAVRITDVKQGVGAFQWSPDGSQIAFLMAEPMTEEEEAAVREKRDAWVVDENLKKVQLYVTSVGADAGDKPRRLTEGDYSIGASFGGGAGFDWSPDGSSIVFGHVPRPKVDDWTEADLSVVDVATGSVRPLASTGAAESGARYSPDGQWIAFTASDDPPSWAFTRRVYVVPAEGGTPRALADTHDEQPSLIGWSADGRSVLVSETYRTVGRVSAVPVDGGASVDVTPTDLMVGGASLNRSATHVGFTSQATDRAPEVFVSRLDRFEPLQVSRVQDLHDAPLGRTEVVSWTARDGMSIEGLLTHPVGYQEGEQVPMLVIVHGGPTGVFTQSFIGSPGSYPVATFSAQGYAILRANVRGSSGYGRAFRYANYDDWGGGDYQDIMSGVDAMIDRGIADPDRLGVMGWSYGGYMTSWVITQTDRFRAASVGAGLPNLMSFAGTADVPGFIPDYFGGEYWDVLEKWQARSAMFNIKGVTTPTLIQHGEQDDRVPISQAYELYNALHRQGVETKMVVYPRQPHGIREPKLQLDAMHRNVEWFNRWVKPRTPQADGGAPG
jgi:dipeptidyl aminopeptidase/acylaminoacyl peptidase